MRIKIYKCNLIFTASPTEFNILKDGYVVVDGQGVIVFVGESLPSEYEGASVIDFGDKLLLPSFYDLHLHAGQYRNVGLALDEELLPWLEKYTFPEEAKYADLGYATKHYRRFVHELWMQGTLRSAIFATVHHPSTALLMHLIQESGMGAYVGLVAMDRNCPSYLQSPVEETIEHIGQLQKMDSDLVKTIITPRFIPACTPEMLRALGQLTSEFDIPVQSHLSENQSEIAWVKQLEPDASCYADAYNKYGLLGRTPTLMAHCCYSTETEIDLLAEKHVFVVHCPTSNDNLASGVAPIRQYLNRDIPIGLGTDISGGHYMSMLRVIQYAIQMSKLHYVRSEGLLPYLSLSEAFYLATKGGGQFFGKCGSFEVGYNFDALLVDDSYLNYDNYSLPERLERYIYIGDDRDIRRRFCQGVELIEPVMG